MLDVNETLSDLSPVDVTLQGHGASPDLARAWFAALLRDGFALSLHHRAPTFADLARQVLLGCLAPTDLDAPPDQVADEVMDVLTRLDVHPDVAPGIEALTDQGHVVSTFSNGSVASTRDLLARAGVLDRVGATLSVEDGDVWKPHPAAYATAVRTLGTPAAELTMVAVHPWDLHGASAAGLHTVWIDRSDAPWPTAFGTPERRVTSLTDLASTARS